MVVTAVVCRAVNPVTDPGGMHAAVQVNVPPVTSERSVVLKVVPEQMGRGVVLTRCGVGCKVTDRSDGGPSQP